MCIATFRSWGGVGVRGLGVGVGAGEGLRVCAVAFESEHVCFVGGLASENVCFVGVTADKIDY